MRQASRGRSRTRSGQDYNGDGRGIGYNVPSLLGIEALPPFYHNGACETLACVVGQPEAPHRERQAAGQARKRRGTRPGWSRS